MKKTLVALGILTTLLIGTQTSFAACPCENPCPVVAPCQTVVAPCCPVVSPACPVSTTCNLCTPKCKCKWYKIFQNKTCCDKPTKCGCGLVAKRSHWYKFWEDRCVVKQSVKCDCCDKCDNNCDGDCCDKCKDCCD